MLLDIRLHCPSPRKRKRRGAGQVSSKDVVSAAPRVSGFRKILYEGPQDDQWNIFAVRDCLPSKLPPLATFLPPRPSHSRYHGCLAVKLRTFVAHFVVRARIGVLCVRLVDGDPSVAACTTVARFIAEMEPKMSALHGLVAM